MTTTIPFFQVDAFSSDIFKGNPAGVCPLNQWPEDSIMQKIAFENNLSETAFFVPENNHYRIRWFTPAIEVDLCGHATLASGHVLFTHLNFDGDIIEFSSRSGMLKVSRKGDLYTLDFPADTIQKTDGDDFLIQCFGKKPESVWKGREDFLLVFEDEDAIRNLNPDFRLLSTYTGRGVIVTSPGNSVDFVSRFFAPQAGIDEDPVTGSAHTTLTPYWADRLGKNELSAKQISARGGNLFCKLNNSRVEISGNAVTYLKGEISI